MNHKSLDYFKEGYRYQVKEGGTRWFRIELTPDKKQFYLYYKNNKKPQYHPYTHKKYDMTNYKIQRDTPEDPYMETDF